MTINGVFNKVHNRFSKWKNDESEEYKMNKMFIKISIINKVLIYSSDGIPLVVKYWKYHRFNIWVLFKKIKRLC